MENFVVAEQDVQTEQELIEEAKRWSAGERYGPFQIGRLAYEWTEKYASGRTDSDFGELIGLSENQVQARRRVFERFGIPYLNIEPPESGDSHPGGVHDPEDRLNWSHYRAAPYLG